MNSTDEKEMLQRRLPEDQYEFVELVERGRDDWLEAACRTGVRCDVLVVSGHFDGTTEFYSDRPGASEFLPVAELERASCSASCPALFSRLQEVYLFGCNTLNADATRSASAEVGRSLVRAGHSQAAARRLSRDLDQRHAESSRDRMRRIFANVPVIYGFAAVAPLGPTAATLLGRYLQPAALSEVGGGRVSARLLNQFSAESAEAEIGATGLELLLPLTLKWADESGIALSAALAKITSDAARILAIDAGHLSPGSAADICVFDPERYWKVAPAALKSQGKNTPFLGLELKGRVRQTLVEGQIVYEAK